MTADVWSDRAELYRQSAIHATGHDLDLVVEWCEPGEGVTVLDVATGGGHVARRLRDPSHVRNYGVAEWESFFELAGLRVAEQRHLERPLEIDPWLERTRTPAADAARVRELLGDRIVDGWMNLPTLVIKGLK